jgi:hypothetical protein
MENLYLKRYAIQSRDLDIDPPDDLMMVVTVPAFKEPNLIESLNSIASCTPPRNSVLVLVVINQSEDCNPDDEQINLHAYTEATRWAKANNTESLVFEIIWVKDMPSKHAGVGLARKTAMDEAVRIFEKLKANRPSVHEEGIIVCFDADCQCDANYLQEIERVYLEERNCPAAVVYYEHPLYGQLDTNIYASIAKYELFLRYHVNALRYSGFPYAFQTVGSCMTVRSSVYQKQGGMNKKQAGEDFYFLQKLFPLEGFREINGTRVIPSPRRSNRVPFGTGKAIADLIDSKGSFPAYPPQSYNDVKRFLSKWQEFYYCPSEMVKEMLISMPQSIRLFMEKNAFEDALNEIRASSPSLATFYKKFFHWLNGFRILKFIHFARDNFYPSIEVEEAAAWLLKEHYDHKFSDTTAKGLLLEFRKIDRGVHGGEQV